MSTARVQSNPVPDWPRLLAAARLPERGLLREFIVLHFEEALAGRQHDWEGAVVPYSKLQDLRFSAVEGPVVEQFLSMPGVENRKGVVSFERGFVEDLRIGEECLVRHGRAIYDRAPITSLELTKQSCSADVAQSGLLRQIKHLWLLGAYTNEDVRTYAESGALSGLLTLIISGSQCDYAALEALAASSSLNSLEELTWSENAIPTPAETYETTQLDYYGPVDVEKIELPELGRKLEETYGEKKWLHAPSRYGHDVLKLRRFVYDDEMIEPPPDWARAEIEAAGLGHLIFERPTASE